MFKVKEVGILIVLIVLFVVLSISSPVFFTVDNMIDIVRGNVVLGILAIGMTLVIIIGGIDVSVGATTTAVTVVLGKFMVQFGYSLPVVLLLSAAVGTLLGAINGLLVSRIKVHAIVVTLGTLSVFQGTTMYVTGGTWINRLPESFIQFGRTNLFEWTRGDQTYGMPVQILFLVLVALMTWYILRHLQIGRSVYAVGGNPLSAVRAGIRLERVQMFVYAYMGFLSGVAAFVHTSIMRQVDPSAFTAFELQVIAAVVLGGASIMGGSGSIGGTLLGVALLAFISNGLTLARIPSYWHPIIIGLFIVLSVSFDVVQRKRAESKLARIDVA